MSKQELGIIVQHLGEMAVNAAESSPTRESLIPQLQEAALGGDEKKAADITKRMKRLPREGEREKRRQDVKEAFDFLVSTLIAAGLNDMALSVSEKGISALQDMPKRTEQSIGPSNITPVDEIVLCGILQRKGVLEGIEKDVLNHRLDDVARDKLPAGKTWKEELVDSREEAALANRNQPISTPAENESLERIRLAIQRLKKDSRGWYQLSKKHKAFNLLQAIINETRKKPEKIEALKKILFTSSQNASPEVTINGEGILITEAERQKKI